MLARYLQWLCAAATATALLMLLLLPHSFLAALALLGTILLGFAVPLAAQFIACAQANRNDEVPSPSAAQLLKAWLIETWVAIKVFLYYQLIVSNRFRDTELSNVGTHATRGVVLVHGFVCNRGIWSDWYPALLSRKIPYIAVNLEPVFGSIDAYGEQLADAVNRLRGATGLEPVVVCHSMGGLAVRAWLQKSGKDMPVHRVVTIGSPHHGTRLGGWAPEYAVFARNARQMRFGSRWLQSLVQQECVADRSRFVCFYSNCDNIVFPASSAALPGADNRHVPGIPHLAMAFDPTVREQTLRLL